ncbi:MAG TPA: response regulator transcription factor [Mycobacterium sp.]|nr:response regulator transcription factor [Mycobacterium sp.]
MNDYPATATTSGPPVGAPNAAEGRQLAESAGGLSQPVCDQSAGNGRRGVVDPRLPSSTRQQHNGWDKAPVGGSRTELTWAADGHGFLRDTKVLIIDDSKLCREYLAGVVAANGAALPTVAWDLSSLITAFEDATPRVILLNTATRDNSMLLRRALEMSPHARVIVLGLSEDDESEIVACAEAGVAGYHTRSQSLEDLILMIRKVAAGESLCSPRVSAILLRRLSALASQRQPVAEELVLTARETQILRMLELGLSNREIAGQLCIAVHTVKNHVHSLLTKLGVSTRAQAAALSRTMRYAEGDPRN